MPKSTNTDLYRSVIKGTFPGDVFVIDDKPVEGLLYPRFYTTTYEDASGQTRTSQADLTVTVGQGGEEIAQADGGTSMFDCDGWFGFANWDYFRVPSGTPYPDSLFIRRGKSKRQNKSGTRSGRHYQIEPKNPMTVTALKGALETFARAAVARQVEIAKSKV